jgi:hypothetical protein
MNGFLTWWRCDADARGRAGGVLVGRGAADRGARAARRSRRAGSSALGFVVAVPDRPGVGAGCAGAWPAVDLDGDVRAVDGDQAAHWLGVRDAGAGGLGLVASAAVLSDRDRSAGPGRVNGPKARPPARRECRPGDHQDGDREGPARDQVQRPGGEDRLDGHRGRRSLSVRRDARVAGSQDTRARRQKASETGRRQGAGSGPFPVGRQGGTCDLQDPGQAHWGGQGASDEAQPTGWPANRPVRPRGEAARRRGDCIGPGSRRQSETPGRQAIGRARESLSERWSSRSTVVSAD